MILVRASHVIQGRQTKNYSVDCVQENHQFFFGFFVRWIVSTFFGPLSAKTWGKMTETPDDSQNFCSSLVWVAGWTPLAGTVKKF
jgi:hypothetical protein